MDFAYLVFVLIFLGSVVGLIIEYRREYNARTRKQQQAAAASQPTVASPATQAQEVTDDSEMPSPELQKILPNTESLEARVNKALEVVRKQVKVSSGINSSLGRWLVFLTLCGGPLTLLFWGGYVLGSFASGTSLGGMLGGLMGSGIYFYYFFKYKVLKMFVISVPEESGWVTIGIVTGKQRSYGTGWKVKYPTEQAKLRNVVNIRNRTKTYGKDGDEDFAAEDGPKMVIRWSMQWVPVLAKLPYYIASEESTIEDGFGELGAAYFSNAISKMNAEDARKKVLLLEEGLLWVFGKTDARVKNGVRHALEELYGIHILMPAVADVDYEERYQQIQTTEAKAVKTAAIVAKLRGNDKEISQKDAMNAALIMNGDVQKTVHEYEGLAGAVTAVLERVLARAS